MKKLLLILLTAMLGLGSLQMSAQTIVEILGGGGTATNSYLPSYSFYNYSLTQQIYTAGEIGMPGAITSISFYNGGSEKTRTYTVYLVHTDKESFTSGSDWITVTQGDEVFTGNVTMAASTWTTITFDTPFQYDGSNNLAVIVDDNTGSYSGGMSCYVFDASAMAIRVYSDGTNYNPMAPNYSGTVENKKNQIKLEIIPGDISCHPVGALAVSDVTPTDAIISWGSSEDAGTTLLQYKTSTQSWDDPNVVTVTPTDTFYNFSDMLNPMTIYNVRVSNICGGGDTSVWRGITFTTACADINTLPYINGFDTYGTGEAAYPDCWTKINTYSSNRPYINSTNYEGVGSLYFYAGSGTYNIAIMPAIDATYPINTLQANFMYRGFYASDRLIVGIIEDITDASTFVPVDTVYPATSYTSWDERTVLFDSYTGTGRNIAFKNEYTTTYGYAYIDNLTVETIPTCIKPTNVTLNNYTVEGCDVDWTPNGEETSWEVVAVPAGADVNTGTPEATSTHPYTLTDLEDDTEYDVYVRASCDGGDFSGWSFKKSFTTDPLCTSPLNPNITQITGSSAMVNWEAALYGANGYTVGYSESGQENWTTQSVTTTFHMLSGLEPNTDYDVFILSECDPGDADTVFANFTTHCLAGGDPFTEGDINTYYTPVNNFYNYTYSQQIFLASEMGGPQTIDSIAFYYAYSTPSSSKTDVTLYLGHTDKTTFSNSSDYVQASNLQQVYTGNMNCQQGWNTFVFTTPFQYNGAENLVIAVDDNSGDYDGSAFVFHAHNAGAKRTLYYYSDGTNPDPNNPSNGSPNTSTSTNRNDVKFFNPCDNTITCIAPNIYVAGTDVYSVTLAWASGNTETSWELEYRPENDTDWTVEGTISTVPYTVPNLNSNTVYYFRMRSVCGGGEFSTWSTTSARTDCAEMTTLPYTENFDTYGTGESAYPLCWGKINTYSSERPYINTSSYEGVGSLYFYAGSYGTYNIAIAPPFVSSIEVNTLQATFMYKAYSASDMLIVGVMTDPTNAATFVAVDTVYPATSASTWEEKIVSFEDYTGNGQYIAFLNAYISTTAYAYMDNLIIETIPTCRKPQQFAVAGTTATTVSLEWLDHGETSWNIEYGPTGFTQGSEDGTIVSASTNPFTVDNLTTSVPYDFYVQADCGGEESVWIGPVSATPGSYNMPTTGNHSVTTCDMIIYDDGGANGSYSTSCESYLTIYPEITGNLVAISGTYSTETSWDYLYVHDGDANGALLGTFNGTGTISELVSTTGPLTLHFHSDASVVYPGFELTVSCVSTTCPRPTELTVSNVGINTADLSWTPGGSETSWIVEYKEISASTWTTTTVSSTNYQLTGLTSLTAYNVRVAADCSDETSQYATASFTTAACATSDQCTYTFIAIDGYGDGWNDGYLTIEQNGVIVGTVEAIDHDLSNTTTMDTITVNLCDGISTELVWHIGEYDDEVTITLIGPDGTQLFTVDDLEENYSSPLFTFTTDCNGAGPVITNPTVATNAATNIAQTTATLNATITNPDNVTITAKGFEWKTTTGGSFTQIAGTGTGNSFTANLTGLTASTGYTFKAFITYNGTTVYGTEQTFTTQSGGTPDPCDVPMGITTSNITKESITVGWDANPNVTTWNIQYRPQNGTLSSATSTTNSYVINGLTPVTTYEIQVQAVCSNGQTSEWSSIVTATTLPDGIVSHLENSVNLYPNPANEVVNVQCTMNNVQVEAVEVIDVYGKVIRTVVEANDYSPLQTTQINVSGLANGMYFVRVTTDQGVVTKPFVKK